MANSSFEIIGSVKLAYSFLADEWKYMVKIAWPALLASIITSMFVNIYKTDVSIFEKFLWELPSVVFVAFVIFQQTRLILIGERLEKLPENPLEYQMRAKALIASIGFYLLFTMLMIVFQGVADKIIVISGATEPEKMDSKTFLLLGAILFLGIWSIRLSLLPITSAVGYPVKLYLAKVKGAMFSLRVMGVSLIACLPVLFLWILLFSSFVGDPDNVTEIGKLVTALIAAPIGLIMVLVINASLTFALKEVLGRDK